MANELHIQLHADIGEAPEEVLRDFPFEPGQAVIAVRPDLVVIDMGEAEDTSTTQEWYLNGNDGVFSFYVVGD